MKPGLEVTRRLATLAGDPQDRLRFVHVAGTNGKGSVCAFLDSLCRRAGLRVGLFTSPHLVSFRERVQVNRRPIPEEDVARWLTLLRQRAEADGLHPTFFEYVTVLALAFFADQGCELVVLETGMGGRLDSTNIVAPLVSVITRIGIDHAAYLGHTLEAIAGEKAGIIKPRIPVISAPQAPEAATVIRHRAAHLAAPLIELPTSTTMGPAKSKGAVQEFNNSCFLGLTPLEVVGAYRRRNAAVATAAWRVLEDLGAVPSMGEIRQLEALRSTEWPGRLQRIHRGERTWLLDGAHNEDGLLALVEVLSELAPKGSRSLILGMLADKDPGAAIPALSRAFDRILLVPVASVRGRDPGRVEAAFARAGRPVELLEHLPSAMAAVDSDLVVVAGSFYLVGEALERLEAVPEGLRSERELNEYGR
jgi:dihydrofolate synthase/folylpolyglutamate synthase